MTAVHWEPLRGVVFLTVFVTSLVSQLILNVLVQKELSSWCGQIHWSLELYVIQDAGLCALQANCVCLIWSQSALSTAETWSGCFITMLSLQTSVHNRSCGEKVLLPVLECLHSPFWIISPFQMCLVLNGSSAFGIAVTDRFVDEVRLQRKVFLLLLIVGLWRVLGDYNLIT